MPSIERHIDLYKTYSNKIREIYFSTDARGRIIDINEAFMLKTGYGPEVIGRHYLFLAAPHERRIIQQFFRDKLPSNENIIRTEFQALLKNGSRIWVEQQTRILRDVSGAPTHFQNIVRDVTERVQHQIMESSLRTTLQSISREETLDSSLRTVCRRIAEDIAPAAVTCLISHHSTPFETDLLHLQDGTFTSEQIPSLFRDLFAVDDHYALFMEQKIGTRLYSRITTPLPSTVADRLFHDGRRPLLAAIAPVNGLKSLDVAFIIWKAAGNICTPFELMYLRSYKDIIGSAIERIDTQDELHRLYLESLRSKERQELLARRLIELQDHERRSIAHEIHDELGQLLTLAKITIQKMTKPGVSALDLRHLQSLNDTISEGLARVRSIAQDLHPAVLNDLGLLPALLALAEKVQDRTHCTVTIDHDDAHLLLNSEQRLAVYRVIQEAITNSLRHGNASAMRISIERFVDRICITAQDNGTGFNTGDRDRSNRGIGLIGMEERIHHSGGSFRITSVPREGTRIIIHYPLDHSAPHEHHLALAG